MHLAMSNAVTALLTLIFVPCRIVVDSPGKVVYFHPHFLRGNFDSLSSVTRIATKKKKKITHRKDSSVKSNNNHDLKKSSEPGPNDIPHVQADKQIPPTLNDDGASLQVEPEMKRGANQNGHPDNITVDMSLNTDDLVAQDTYEQGVSSFCSVTTLLRLLDADCSYTTQETSTYEQSLHAEQEGLRSFVRPAVNTQPQLRVHEFTNTHVRNDLLHNALSFSSMQQEHEHVNLLPRGSHQAATFFERDTSIPFNGENLNSYQLQPCFDTGHPEHYCDEFAQYINDTLAECL